MKRKTPQPRGAQKEQILKVAQELEKQYNDFIRQCEVVQENRVQKH